MIRPAPALAAHRRRLFVWLPILLLGFAIIMMTGSMFQPTANGAHLLGCLVAIAGAFGFAREAGK